ncbi:hypothetical protein MARINON1_50916 [Marinobacter salarius]|nr:hypothetical protein MBHK15_130694 [Marinobacter salarius]VXB63314.1 hypothetical protein MARINON1_50916 [Marinobacter salarius]
MNSYSTASTPLHPNLLHNPNNRNCSDPYLSISGNFWVPGSVESVQSNAIQTAQILAFLRVFHFTSTLATGCFAI